MNRDFIEPLEFNFGPEIMQAFADPAVLEIMLNDDGKVWIERFGQPMEQLPPLNASMALNVFQLLATGEPCHCRRTPPCSPGGASSRDVRRGAFSGISAPCGGSAHVLHQKASDKSFYPGGLCFRRDSFGKGSGSPARSHSDA